MKIIVDSLPYDSSSCPFNFADSWGYSLCPCRNDVDKCPMYWGLNKMFSDDNPRQCERFIEYRKFIELRKGTPILNRKDLLRLKENAGGTKERDICYCKGDKCKCDIYPDIKQKALKEKQSKPNAKQKDNNLKHIKESLEFYLDSHEENGVVYIPKFIVEKIIKELK